MSFDDNHPILSAEEVAKAKEKARKRLEKEMKDAALKAVEDKEVQRLKSEEGMVSGDPAKDELVNITIDLAEHSSKLTVDGREYWHGQTYNVPRHVANSLREQMFRGWTHEAEINGKSKKAFYDAKRQAEIWREKKGGAVI